MNGLSYEHFVRDAFSISLGTDIERGGDPARLAEAGLFSLSSSFSQIKVATAYAMEIYNNIFRNRDDIDLDILERLHSIIDDVINAPDVDVIHELIGEYRNNFLPYLN